MFRPSQVLDVKIKEATTERETNIKQAVYWNVCRGGAVMELLELRGDSITRGILQENTAGTKQIRDHQQHYTHLKLPATQ